MSANMFCWHPRLGLSPADADFNERVDEIQDSHLPPTPELLAFVQSLLTHSPDLTETEDTVWAEGPLAQDVVGDFMNMGISWSGYQHALPVVVATAREHGLHSFDPQTEIFYPATTSRADRGKETILARGIQLARRLTGSA
ncbi:hypothetical protein IAI18_04485 [Acetobacteraceae bacterium H6797]|nr:hypothetical protein [Acetobacteraceae bacterium H6797]